MAKCKLCGNGGMFSRVTEIGMCPSCHNRFLQTVPRLYDIYQESVELAKTSRNIETVVSRMELAVGKLEEIKLFGNGIDVMNLVDPELHADDLIKLVKSAFHDVLNIQTDLDGMILGSLEELGEISKSQISGIIKSSVVTAGATIDSFPYDVDKMLPDMLNRLSDEGRIAKRKLGNKYVYSLSPTER